jgi:hypothetical protein
VEVLVKGAWRRGWKRRQFLLLLLASGCQPKHDARTTALSPPPPVYFSKNWKAEIDFPAGAELNGRCGIVHGDNGDLIAFLSTDNGFLQSVSRDKGLTWSPLKSKFAFDRPAAPIFLAGRLCGVITWEKIANGGQFYFHARKEEGWAEPSPIRDTNWGNFSYPTFAADSFGNVYCVWQDWREGNPDIYFSSSGDGGKTWGVNVRIDDDQAGQEQTECRLLATSKGTLYAFWADNRDPETLFDIYCSSSHDGGKNWNPGVKVNADTTHTFQTFPFAVVDDHGTLYAVWSDYRDKGTSGDILPTIYFARSANGGKSWSPNIRLSTVNYQHNLTPVLALAENGQMHCLWQSTEDYIRSDIFHSYSRDGGTLWSAPVRVNDNLERVPQRLIGSLGPDAEGNIVLGWLNWRDGQPAVYLTKSLAHPDPARVERKPPRHITSHETKPALFAKPGKTLFQDDFAANSFSRWEVESGAWVCRDQTYIGYGTTEARSFTGNEFWQDYIFQGRFKLDPIDHRSAYIYLRVTKDKEERLRYYRLSNYFRTGVTLEYFDGKTRSPQADAPYPFQKDRWYEFRAVMQDSILNYFIADSLLIATDKLIHLSRGRIGIGAFFTPAYFKNIQIIRIK